MMQASLSRLVPCPSQSSQPNFSCITSFKLDLGRARAGIRCWEPSFVAKNRIKMVIITFWLGKNQSVFGRMNLFSSNFGCFNMAKFIWPRSPNSSDGKINGAIQRQMYPGTPRQINSMPNSKSLSRTVENFKTKFHSSTMNSHSN